MAILSAFDSKRLDRHRVQMPGGFRLDYYTNFYM